MSNFFEDENGEYLVVVNHEGQHSLWRPFKAIPAGWSAVGPRGNRADCLAYIEQHWTDMRPKSLVEFMRQHAQPASDPA
jgi:MbtH protein